MIEFLPIQEPPKRTRKAKKNLRDAMLHVIIGPPHSGRSTIAAGLLLQLQSQNRKACLIDHSVTDKTARRHVPHIGELYSDIVLVLEEGSELQEFQEGIILNFGGLETQIIQLEITSETTPTELLKSIRRMQL